MFLFLFILFLAHAASLFCHVVQLAYTVLSGCTKCLYIVYCTTFSLFTCYVTILSTNISTLACMRPRHSNLQRHDWWLLSRLNQMIHQKQQDTPLYFLYSHIHTFTDHLCTGLSTETYALYFKLQGAHTDSSATSFIVFPLNLHSMYWDNHSCNNSPN